MVQSLFHGVIFMKKIYINKNDLIPSVVERIIQASETELIVYIPRFSKLLSTKGAFHLLKREAEAAHKTISVESVDDQVVDLASTAGISAINPFFSERNRATVSDIVPPGVRRSVSHPSSSETNAPEVLDTSPQEVFQKEVSRQSSVRMIAVSFVSLFILVGGSYAAFTFLPRAQIDVVLEETKWEYVNSVSADVNLSERSGVVKDGAVTILGEILSERKNLSMQFPASAKKIVERKSEGVLIIYNGYDSRPQQLVKTTRFKSPDGKIFRLDEGVTVPGAKIADGKIQPSSIEAAVTADKPGEEYNLPAGVRFVIPGFEGKPQYQGFYAESKGALSGGVIGEMSVPTEDDIATAKEETREALQDAFAAQFTTLFPENVTFLKDASRLLIVKEQAIEGAVQDGTFSYFIEGEMQAFVFREDDLLKNFGKLVLADAQTELVPKDYSFTYGVPEVNFQAGKLSVPVTFQSVWTYPFDRTHLAEEAQGKTEQELTALLLSVPGIKSASVSLWPFWVKRAPGGDGKVRVAVQ